METVPQEIVLHGDRENIGNRLLNKGNCATRKIKVHCLLSNWMSETLTETTGHYLE